ncbi:MAG TPA: PIG-L family deacetylase [Opitutaceae bacterium]|nr:PIG-L family deacetylase [Opitutaceae bacterium]
MKFSHENADVYVPGGGDPVAALRRVTHLCVGAHQDDIEIMAYAGIATSLKDAGKAFGGVVATNGAGSPRTGPFAAMTDTEMQQVRRNEQRQAADLGRYAIQIQLAHPTAVVKQPGAPAVVEDLRTIFLGCSPEVVYLHNPADKHDTHVALLLRCLEALRSLPEDRRPKKVLGCEVWRDLDWLADERKVPLDTGKASPLAEQLISVFASQVAGGKRYDVATLGRRSANATFSTPRATDAFEGITWAVDLTELLSKQAPTLAEFTGQLVADFQRDVRERIARYS